MSNRMTLKLVTTSLFLLGASSTYAMNNPLNPNYYAEKFAPNAPTLSALNSTPYADVNNPLHPHFARMAEDAKWLHTSGKMSIQLYVDSNNPRHPMYHRQ